MKRAIYLSISNIFVCLISENLVYFYIAEVLHLVSIKIVMIEESVLIWMEVKKAAPDIIKAGGNPIEV